VHARKMNEVSKKKCFLVPSTPPVNKGTATPRCGTFVGSGPARAWLQSSQPSWVVLVNRGTGVQPSARPWSVWFHPTGMSACVASDQGIVGLAR
jgi:hypothetical protein